MVKEPEAWQMASKEAMELGQSPSMSWEDQVQEEEQQKHDSSAKGNPNSGLPPPLLEGENTSDVSMVDDSPLQHDSDMVVKEEEREESMDTDVPASPSAPAPLKEMPM